MFSPTSYACISLPLPMGCRVTVGHHPLSPREVIRGWFFGDSLFMGPSLPSLRSTDAGDGPGKSVRPLFLDHLGTVKGLNAGALGKEKCSMNKTWIYNSKPLRVTTAAGTKLGGHGKNKTNKCRDKTNKTSCERESEWVRDGNSSGGHQYADEQGWRLDGPA